MFSRRNFNYKCIFRYNAYGEASIIRCLLRRERVLFEEHFGSEVSEASTEYEPSSISTWVTEEDVRMTESPVTSSQTLGSISSSVFEQVPNNSLNELDYSFEEVPNFSFDEFFAGPQDDPMMGFDSLDDIVAWLREPQQAIVLATEYDPAFPEYNSVQVPPLFDSIGNSLPSEGHSTDSEGSSVILYL